MSTALSSSGNQPGVSERKFLGQPWGLANLFGIELWERFSFYGMQSLLAFYIYYSASEGGLGFSENAAVSIVGAYGGFVYMMALVASLVADRMIGSERTLFYSAIMVMTGHILLAVVPGALGLALGLVFVGIGSGGVKTAASVVLGQLYSKTDPRRDAGFSIFYLAVNIGAFFGPIITGFFAGMHNFHMGFGAAAIGMAVGLVQYILMRKQTIGDAGNEIPNPLPKDKYPIWAFGAVAIIALVATVVVTGILPVERLSDAVLVVAFAAIVLLLFQMLSSPHATAEEKSRLIGFIPMMLVAVGFFGIFQSQFTVLAVYADQRLDRSLFGWELEPNQIQAFNPLFIMIFAGIFAAMWTKMGKRQPSTPVKFGLASILIGAALFVFIPFVSTGANGTPLIVAVLVLFLFTMAELLLSPVGNSLATKVAPEAFKSRTMAMWLLAISMGTAFSGTLGSFYDPNDPSVEHTFFLYVGVASIVLGLAVIAIKGWVLKKFIDVR